MDASKIAEWHNGTFEPGRDAVSRPVVRIEDPGTTYWRELAEGESLRDACLQFASDYHHGDSTGDVDCFAFLSSPVGDDIDHVSFTFDEDPEGDVTFA